MDNILTVQALARAIYTSPEVIILDDIFSGLDKTTERAIVQRLFGHLGLLRRTRTTVIIATHSRMCSWIAGSSKLVLTTIDTLLPLSDKITILGTDGDVVTQGTFEALKTSEVLPWQDFTESQVETEEKETPRDVVVEERAANDHDNEDVLRRSGDLRAYGFYFKSIGWLAFLAFIASEICFAFFSVFPSKS